MAQGSAWRRWGTQGRGTSGSQVTWSHCAAAAWTAWWQVGGVGGAEGGIRQTGAGSSLNPGFWSEQLGRQSCC